MEPSTNAPHVVVLPYPSQGHINPLLQFAKRLSSKGIKSTIATTLYTVNCINAPNISIEPISDGYDDGSSVSAQKENVFLESFKQNGSRTLSELIQKYENSNTPITCVVYDSFLPWALDVAKSHGILGAAFFTNSATVCAVFCHIHRGTLSLPVEIEDGSPLILPGLPPFDSRDLPSFIKAPESYPAYLAMKMRQFSNLERADWVFSNTFDELEGKMARTVSETWPAKLIGPMVPSAYLDGRIEGDKGYGASLWKPLGEECLKWLKNKPQKSVIYISFGSMVSLTQKQIEEIGLALKGSDLNFLWVVRESERRKLPNGFIESTQGQQGLVIPWCNQLEMLANPAIGCFVTHCGWNSTLEGLSLGVPMVGMPQWADQMTDAKFIEEIWRVGVRAKEDEFGIVRKEELIFCLKEVMEGDKSYVIRRNASKWKELAREALGDGGSSDNDINDFVKDLTSANRKVDK